MIYLGERIWIVSILWLGLFCVQIVAHSHHDKEHRHTVRAQRNTLSRSEHLHHQHGPHTHGNGICALSDPDPEDMVSMEAIVQRYIQAFPTPDLEPKSPIQIPTVIHVITNSNGEGVLPQSKLDEQMQVLNDAFNQTRFSFYLKASTCTTNDNWYPLSILSFREWRMKTRLRQGFAGTLNIYITSLNDGQFSLGVWPWMFPLLPRYDGILIDQNTVPGGSFPNYGGGKILVHNGT